MTNLAKKVIKKAGAYKHSFIVPITNLAKKAIRKVAKYQFLVLGIAAVSALALVLYWAILPNISPEWTGFGPYDEEVNGPRVKTLWHWMELLIIPVALAIGVWWFNKSERENERTIAEDRRQEARLIAENRQEEARLQAFFDRMTEVFLKEGLLDLGFEQRHIIRTLSLTTLRTLDGERKALVLRFLHEADLIPVGNKTVRLSGADLSGANLSGMDLFEADLMVTDLTGADLSGALLTGVNLFAAKLYSANLSGACLWRANLSMADLRMANLYRADLQLANLSDARVTTEQLAKARRLEGVTMPNGTTIEEWIKSNPEFLEMRDKAARLQGTVGGGRKTKGADDDTETS